MPAALQLLLPFACLDFPGRETVTVWEIAGKLGVTSQHVLDHVDENRLVALDTKLVASRRNLRVPVDEYRRWVLSLLTGPARRQFLAELPQPVLRDIAAEILTSPARREFLAELPQAVLREIAAEVAAKLSR